MDSTFQTLLVSRPREWIAHIRISTNNLNTFNLKFFTELKICFAQISKDSTIRAVVLSASQNSKCFSAGLDLKGFDFPSTHTDDHARQALRFIDVVTDLQAAISSVEKCNKPVIVCTHIYFVNL
jgi:delta(3,5)-delta(2,4)-dienoyl-CoA isomerase